jgi:hypothetical protein
MRSFPARPSQLQTHPSIIRRAATRTVREKNSKNAPELEKKGVYAVFFPCIL